MTRIYGDLLDRLELPTAGTVAVVGPSGAGKSTLAAELADRLGAALLSADDFLIPEDERTAPGLLAKYELDALDAALSDLQAGRATTFRAFDQQSRRRLGQKTVRPAASGRVVVEGIVALYAARVFATSELAAYVDAPAEVREARQLERLDREGWYRDLSRAEVAARVRAKRIAEDGIVYHQLRHCQYAIDTTGAHLSLVRMVTTVAA